MVLPVPGPTCPRPQTCPRLSVFSTENPPGIILNHLKIGLQISEEMIINFANLN
jgi:hypothetical protein